MLDNIQMGMLRLDTKGKPHGYVRIVQKNGEIKNYFRIPLHVVFDLIGYNSFKEYQRQENPEFKTWVQDITINIPPDLEYFDHYSIETGHEWFLGNLRDLVTQYSHFPHEIGLYVQDSIKEYLQAKKKSTNRMLLPEDYSDELVPMNRAEQIAAERAMRIYAKLQRSRFDPGRPGQEGEFMIEPFSRDKTEKTARNVIEKVTEAVADYILANPKVSKYSETEGAGLRIKLTSYFMECFYKEQIRFMQRKLEQFQQSVAVTKKIEKSKEEVFFD